MDSCRCRASGCVCFSRDILSTRDLECRVRGHGVWISATTRDSDDARKTPQSYEAEGDSAGDLLSALRDVRRSFRHPGTPRVVAKCGGSLLQPGVQRIL